jgi:hypothetical protein
VAEQEAQLGATKCRAAQGTRSWRQAVARGMIEVTMGIDHRA